ncbi:MAG: hypothetical protein A3B89_01065 [Candidatus Buchananbacteria bacterium RIFCSPHIGHO2_02_FULL_40_13]|uniref:Uncharacterized protein n=1 Tax=Candidatus Buchananbacteria bacterium RIFCSPLOWO2_01_FULL_39_33 TaxID=1797543 RepID=A0A1G1YH61_9BACT|nr:MAG: hypothetical protein A2820_01135 [Candidatus Buchananbacteria bacterium RIFCSPHIGHO2_01_FULL_40_35]OGY50460.1 MAG: hypothetical protein A3B89_01065 [Candidatus Buchananbacteria bacterium RIFCSPHIGHO2_02_FULL_40_13]OGY51601.1 MAG: hypothetical protein A3A02_02220 [Candidatus Buchananbacteria bacterium RIFCSPLOWO2_01_FULL_39_33]
MKYGNVTLGKIEAVWNKLGGEDGVNQFLRGELTVKGAELLKRVTTMAVSGTKRFVANEHRKETNVGLTGSNFEKLFLEKVEENVGDAIIAIDRLVRASLNASIRAELGSRAEIKLAHFFEVLKAQSGGEAGVLLVNGYANIAYIRGADKKVWAVDAYWGSDCGFWRVDARSVGGPSGWCAGRRVLSRDS